MPVMKSPAMAYSTEIRLRNQTAMVLEIQEDRKALEKLTGHLVQGMSYAFGNYNEEIIEIAKSLGIKYSRTVKDTKGFPRPQILCSGILPVT